MSLTPTTPNVEPVPIVESRAINHFDIVTVTIHTPIEDGDPDRVVIHWREAHDDGTTKHWKPGVKNVEAIALPTDPTANPHGNALLALMAAVTGDGVSNYAATKAMAYQFLVDAGLVPEGALS